VGFFLVWADPVVVWTATLRHCRAFAKWVPLYASRCYRAGIHIRLQVYDGGAMQIRADTHTGNPVMITYRTAACADHGWPEGRRIPSPVMLEDLRVRGAATGRRFPIMVDRLCRECPNEAAASRGRWIRSRPDHSDSAQRPARRPWDWIMDIYLAAR